MDFKEWQASRRWCDDLGRVLDDEDFENVQAWLYGPNDDYIEVQYQDPQLTIYYVFFENTQYHYPDLGRAEQKLWDLLKDWEARHPHDS